eukprot:685073_1
MSLNTYYARYYGLYGVRIHVNTVVVDILWCFFIIIVPILVGFVSHFVSNSCSSSNDADYLLWDGFSQPYHGADYHICNLVLMENRSSSYPRYSFYRTRFFGSWVCYHIFQTMIPTIWCALSNKSNNKCNCKLKCKHCK